MNILEVLIRFYCEIYIPR